MKIYLAGKVGRDDWRHDILADLVRHQYDIDLETDWPIWVGAFGGRHDYTGPYFAEQGHGAGHGDNQHGNMVYPDRADQQIVFERCKRAINRSDLVFAWIDTLDCFGTIAELGYAHALNKTIAICGPKRYPDLWFIYALAKHTSFIQDPDPEYDPTDEDAAGWHIPYAGHFLEWCADGPPNHREYINSASWNTRAEAAKDRAGQRCQVCNRHRNQVILDAHHRTYERLGWELPDDITVLCRDCHELYESNKRAKQAPARVIQVTQPRQRNRHKR